MVKLLLGGTQYILTLAGITIKFMRTFLYFFVSIILVPFNGDLLAQNYFPIEPGTKWHYRFGNDEVIQEVSATTYEFNGRTYHAIIDITPEKILDSSRFEFEGKVYYTYRRGRYGMALDTMYVREDSVGNIYWFDQHSNGESLFIPNRLTKGKIWQSYDRRYEFKIVSLKGTFQSASTVFRNCLVISIRKLATGNAQTSFHFFL